MFSAAQKLISFYVLLGVVVVEALVYGGLTLYASSVSKRMAAAEEESASVDRSIKQSQEDLQEAIRYQQRLANLELLLGSHVFWSPVFEELTKYTYRSVSFDTMSGSLADNKLVLTGTAPSFTDIAKLILGLKQSEKIKDVVFQSSGQSKEEKSGYAFSLEITLDPELFKK